MKVTLQYLNTPSSDTLGTTLLLRFDDKRYMFGHVCEGTQRALVEYSVRLGKLNDVFMSGRTEWKNTGGLIGMLLTAADVQASQRENVEKLVLAKQEARERWLASVNANVTDGNGKRKLDEFVEAEPESIALRIHGPKNLMNTIAMARSFVYRQDMALTINEFDFEGYDDYPSFKDSHITVHPIGVTPVKMELKYAAQRAARHKVTSEKTPPRSMARFFEEKAQLQKVLQAMFNMKSGTLEVKKEDTDYLKSLVQRLKDDHEAKALEKGGKINPINSTGSNDNAENIELGGSPSKKLKYTSENLDDLDDSVVPHPSAVLQDGRPLRRPWPATGVTELPFTQPSPTSISYIVSLPPTRGRFLPKHAISLGVKPGPDFARLTKGETIITKDGKEVKPSDVMEPDIIIPSIAILDIPSVEYIADTLREIDVWKNDGPGRNIKGWNWIIGQGVEKNPILLDYMRSNAGDHTVSSSAVCPDEITFVDATSQMTRLNILDNKIYPLPYQRSSESDKSSQYVGVDKVPEVQEQPYASAQSLMEYEVYPIQRLLDLKVQKPFDFGKVRDELKNHKDSQYIRLAADAQKNTELLEAEGPQMGQIPGKDVELWTLGTGSALPSKYRNVSANVLRVPDVGNILFDCGENTLGQLRRLLRPGNPDNHERDDYNTFFLNLKCIYISHMHADHHLGTTSVIKAWYEMNGVRGETLYVVGPPKLLQWLREYSFVEDIGFHCVRFVSCESLLDYDNLNTYADRVADFKERLCLSDVRTSPAKHCKASYTTAFTFNKPKGFKFAYSGDTRPTPGFTTIGKGATLLLHEATFDDELAAEAVAKRHSTTAEAIRAGKDMGARALLLTHFSQRYPKLPVIESTDQKPLEYRILADTIGEKVLTDADIQDTMEIDKSPSPENGPILKKSTDHSAMKIGLAFDLQRIKVGDFWKLETFIPALRELFKEEEKVVVVEEDIAAPAGLLSRSSTPISKKQAKKQQKDKARKQAKGEQNLPIGRALPVANGANHVKNSLGKDLMP